MLAVVLGAAAGGGFPQWNSSGPGCQRARSGDRAAKPRTQASIAVSADGKSWFLLNAAPDLRQQIEATDVLHATGQGRGSPIAGVVLTGGDVDAIAGLLVLREAHAFTIYAGAQVLATLDANPIFEVLARALVHRERVPLETPTPLRAPGGAPSGLTVTLFAVPGKVPLYLEARQEPPPIVVDGTTVGAAVSDGRRTLFFIPGCAAMTPALVDRLRGADLVLFDGTLWQDDEMIRLGVGTKTGRRMGHMSLTGPEGTFAAFAPLQVKRKILIHINNTNPVLLDDSAARAETAARGWDVAEDGMRIEL
jgi:pyrroloquinoline quinone biosynthesis protein B